MEDSEDRYRFLDPDLFLDGMLRVILLAHHVLRQGIEVLLLDIVVVRDALDSPDAHHKDIPNLLVSDAEFRQVCCQDHVQIVPRQVDAVYIHPGAIELLILPDTVVMETFNLGRVENGFHFLDTLADGVNGVVHILEVGRIVIVEGHIDVFEVVGPALVRLPGTIGRLLDIEVDILVQGHPLRLFLLSGLLLSFSLLSYPDFGIYNGIDDFAHLLLRDGLLILEGRVKISPDRIHLDGQVREGKTEVVQGRRTLL